MANILTIHMQKMIFAYPLIHGHRAACLRYLFCTNSPSYEWENGLLIDKYNPQDEVSNNYWDEEEYLSELVASLPKNFLDNENVLNFKASRSLVVRRHNADIDFRKANADILSRVSEPLSSIPHLSEFSNMACVPDNVHIDYLDGVKEMIFIIFNTPKDGSPSTNYPQEQIFHNIRFADKILSNLSARFPKKYLEEPTSFKEYLDLHERFTNELSASIEAEIA